MTVKDRRTLNDKERSKVLRETARATKRWRHRSAAGGGLRSFVLPELDAASRTERRRITLQVTLLDPADENACREYLEWIRSHGRSAATLQSLENDIYATIVAICVEFKINPQLFHPEVRFSQTICDYHFDISDDMLVLTRTAEPGTSESAPSGDLDYRRFCREFDAGWSALPKLNVNRTKWSYLPMNDRELLKREHIRNLFKELSLPAHAFEDERLDAILERLVHDDGEGDDRRRGVDSAHGSENR